MAAPGPATAAAAVPTAAAESGPGAVAAAGGRARWSGQSLNAGRLHAATARRCFASGRGRPADHGPLAGCAASRALGGRGPDCQRHFCGPRKPTRGATGVL
jgi:hypothetical protein